MDEKGFDYQCIIKMVGKIMGWTCKDCVGRSTYVVMMMSFLLPRARRPWLLSLLTLWLVVSSFVASDYFLSFDDKPTIFNIERSRDPNQIVYKVNVLENGNLDKENPIEAYWVKYTQNGTVEPITWIQKELSYGLKFKEVKDDQAIFLSLIHI